MTTLTDLSLELLDCIFFELDPLDIARVSQTCHFCHNIIYGQSCQQFWRGLYLAQPLDDPRRTVTHLGHRRDVDGMDWKRELQWIVRTRTLMGRGTGPCRREERKEVLKACLALVTNVPPIASPDGIGKMSRNVRWVQRYLGDGAFLERDAWEVEEGEELDEDEEQQLARLHALYGLTRRDVDPERRHASQAFVYSLRHHTPERGYGPFLPDGNAGQEERRHVDWVFMQTLVHVFGMLLLDTETDAVGDTDSDGAYSQSHALAQRYAECFPFGAVFCQCIIPRGVNLDKEEDWAGVEGLWSVRYGFIDHREFLLYNDPSVPDHEPQDMSIFEGAEETLATVDIYFRVASTEPDPLHPTRPKINIVGEVDGRFNIVGFVKLTEDDQLWWHYGAGNDDQIVWSCDAIGLGGIRSRCGNIGVWSTVFHDAEDPIGPFWMQRELLVDEDE